MKKQNILNWIVTGIFLVALVVCYFFWVCIKLDFIVTIIALIVAVFSIVLLSKQNKEIKNLESLETK